MESSADNLARESVKLCVQAVKAAVRGKGFERPQVLAQCMSFSLFIFPGPSSPCLCLDCCSHFLFSCPDPCHVADNICLIYWYLQVKLFATGCYQLWVLSYGSSKGTFPVSLGWAYPEGAGLWMVVAALQLISQHLSISSSVVLPSALDTFLPLRSQFAPFPTSHIPSFIWWTGKEGNYLYSVESQWFFLPTLLIFNTPDHLRILLNWGRHRTCLILTITAILNQILKNTSWKMTSRGITAITALWGLIAQCNSCQLLIHIQSILFEN